MGDNTTLPETVKIGGDPRPKTVLPITDETFLPIYHRVQIKSYKKKQNAKPNKDGTLAYFYSWTLSVLDPKYKTPENPEPVVFGITNTEARCDYRDGVTPLPLLKLIRAALGGKEPAKGTEFSLEVLKGKTVRVQLENKVDKKGTGEIYQSVVEWYPDGAGKVAPATPVPEQASPIDDIPTVNIDEEIKAEDLPF